MKIVSKVNKISRGLAIVLLISMITSTSSLAYTSNELRESIGLKSNKYSYSSDYVPSTEDNNQDANSENTESYLTNEDEQTEEIVEYVETENNITDYLNEVLSLESKLDSRFENNSTAYLITVTIDNILINREKVNELKDKVEHTDDSIVSSVEINEGITEINKDEIDSSYKYDEVIVNSFSEADIQSVSSIEYNIGDIGDSSISVVDKYLKIVTPWGFNKNANEDKFNTKLLGIELYAEQNDDIKAQWNGMVVDIGTDYTGESQYLKIYHGNSTYTVYNNIFACNNITVGKMVYQGQVIGKAADTKKYQPNKENHIFYQIRLNGRYINPILIYGNRGKKLYEEWLKTHPSDNLVESYEKYYNDIDETWNVNQPNDVKEVIYPDFNLNS